MSKRLIFLGFCSWLLLGGLRGTAAAADGETFPDQWNSAWKGIGQSLDDAGKSLRETFFPSPD